MNKKIEKLINRHRLNERYYFVEYNSVGGYVEGAFIYIENRDVAGRFIYNYKSNELTIIFKDGERVWFTFYNRTYSIIEENRYTNLHGLKYEKRKCCFCWKGKELK